MFIQTNGDDIMKELILYACAIIAKPPRGKGCWPDEVLAKGWSRVIPVRQALDKSNARSYDREML
jgi:hypothetical protein